MPTVRAANSEPLPGYRLIEPLGRGGFGEVWKCQAPGGFLKAIKFVGDTDNVLMAEASHQLVRQELHALQLLKTLRHPFLLSVERVEIVDGELIILTELADCSLHDLLEHYRSEGKPGVPRDELLAYLREAAEVLDVMNQEHGLQHLDVKPRNLFLVGNHVKVGDFGLVGSLAELYGPEECSAQTEMISPPYAAPERFQGRVTIFSDQYSLAVTYVELVSGLLPFAGKNFRVLAQQHLHDEPDLGVLPESDRATIRKALAKDPRQRFESCLALIDALLFPGGDTARQPGGTRGTRRKAAARQTIERRIEKPATKHDIALGDPTTTAVIRPALAAGVPREEPVPLADRDPTRQVSSLRPTSPTTPGSGHDPLEGWTYLDCLARFPFGEFWRVRPPAGPDRLVKLVFGFEPRRDARGHDPLDRLRRVGHPKLIPVEIVPTPGRLILLSPYPERTLVDRFEEAVAAGGAGIPREELLDYLGEVAEILDELRQRPGLMHLSLSPRQLVLDDDNALHIADFGLVEMVWQPAGHPATALNTRYAAPELFANKPSPHSDQYSLALLFVELLTGAHPFRNLNQRQMATTRTRGQPDLGMTPARDRPVLATALDPEPRYRFGSCRELIEALAAATSSQRQRLGLRQTTTPLPPLLRRPALNRVLRQLTDEAAGDLQVREFGNQRFLLLPGERISHHCFARLVTSTVPLKLEGFREQWRARLVGGGPSRYRFQVVFPPNWLERFLGRQPGLETIITIEETPDTGGSLSSMHIEVRPVSCSRSRGQILLEDMGPVLLESLRNFLQAAPERRKQERFPFTQPVVVYPLLADDELGEGVSGQTHDVSTTGLGVYLPSALEGVDVAVHLRTPGPQGVLLSGQVVRQAACRDGRASVGIYFGELPAPA